MEDENIVTLKMPEWAYDEIFETLGMDIQSGFLEDSIKEIC